METGESVIPLPDIHRLIDTLAQKRHYGHVQLEFECGQVKLVRNHEVWKQEEIKAKLI